MATVRAGNAPWHEGYKSTGRLDQFLHGVKWSLGSGYKYKDIWDYLPKRGKYKLLTLYDGRKVKVPDDDYNDFIRFSKHEMSEPDTEIGSYIDKAFADKDNVDEVEGCGHILYLEYSEKAQLLRVEFAGYDQSAQGALVVYFRVPVQAYSELRQYAVTKQTMISSVDNKERHVLGMRFWDIIRTRGSLHGGKYGFEYAMENDLKGTEFMREKIAIQGDKSFATRGKTEVKSIKDIDEKELLELYDMYSRKLSKNKKQEYDNLKSVKDKEKLLRRSGIL